MKRRLIAIVLVLTQFSYIKETYAYKRSTHQHITELAFSLIKHAEMCQLSDINKQNMGFCIVNCATDQKLTTENQKLQCIDQCQLDNYPAPSGVTEVEQILRQ